MLLGSIPLWEAADFWNMLYSIHNGINGPFKEKLILPHRRKYHIYSNTLVNFHCLSSLCYFPLHTWEIIRFVLKNKQIKIILPPITFYRNCPNFVSLIFRYKSIFNSLFKEVVYLSSCEFIGSISLLLRNNNEYNVKFGTPTDRYIFVIGIELYLIR